MGHLEEEKTKAPSPERAVQSSKKKPRRTIGDLDKISGDIDEMTRQADVAYANLQATKKVTPKSEKSSKQPVPKVTETSKKSEPPRTESKPLQSGKEKSDADFAAENERLAQEIA